MPRPIFAHIAASAVAHNLSVVKHAAPHAKLWAVIKANAYGHGITAVLPGLAQADGLALLDLNEAETVRQRGWRKPVLLLEGVFDEQDLHTAQMLDLTCVVHCEAQLRLLERASLQRPLSVYLKINSGMNRLGFLPATAASVWQRLRSVPGIAQIDVMTHFSDADSPRGISHQVSVFEQAVQELPGARSLCNSAAIFRYPDVQAEWVRPGVVLYGASPFGMAEPASRLGLQPVMQLMSQLIDIQTLQAGDTVGYGSLFTATQPMRIGVVACGYADGYPRHAPYGTPVCVQGQRTSLVGRVSMDMLTVDLSTVPQAQIGDTVELWGKQLSIDEVAAAADTVGYELMCALAARVPVRVESYTE